VRGHVTGASSYEVTTLRPRGVAVGDTKVSGRRVTSKAPSARVEEGQAAPRRRPQPFSRILTAWKGNSPELVCRMPHSPARWPPYGRPETSRLLKVNHYMLHVPTKRRSGAYASSRQDTDYAGTGGLSGVWAPGSNIESTAWHRCVYKAM
jgi:hypothetical protein